MRYNFLYFKRLLFFAFILVVFGCGPKIPTGFPQVATGTFIIPSPKDFNCYALHDLIPRQSGQRLINLRVNIITTYVDGRTGETNIQDKSVIVDPNIAGTFPLTMNVNIAVDKAFMVRCIIEGAECSECALGNGGGTSQNPTQCTPQSQIEANGLISYRGARRKWEAYKSASANERLISFSEVSKTENVAGSCGCRVYE